MADPTQTISVNLVFDGPTERVFDAWLDPAVARHWLFATKEGEMVRAEIDPTVDGAFTMTERRGGQDVEHLGRYTTIDRPSRLGFAFSVPAVSDRATQVDIGFMPMEDEVVVMLRHSDVPAAFAQATEQGWNDMLDRLALHLAATATPTGPAA